MIDAITIFLQQWHSRIILCAENRRKKVIGFQLLYHRADGSDEQNNITSCDNKIDLLVSKIEELLMTKPQTNLAENKSINSSTMDVNDSISIQPKKKIIRRSCCVSWCTGEGIKCIPRKPPKLHDTATNKQRMRYAQKILERNAIVVTNIPRAKTWDWHFSLGFRCL